MLARSPSEISLLQVMEAVDGPITSGLPPRISFPGETDRRVRTALEGITESVRTRLEEIKLTDLLEPLAWTRLR